MAINKTSSVKEKVQAPEAVPADIDIVLTAHERYHRSGRLFEKGTIYTVEESFARELLRDRTDFGGPVFLRFTPEMVKAKPADGPVRQKVSRAIKAKEQKPDAVTSDKIVIGSEEEEAELFKNVDAVETVQEETSEDGTESAVEI